MFYKKLQNNINKLKKKTFIRLKLMNYKSTKNFIKNNIK